MSVGHRWVAEPERTRERKPQVGGQASELPKTTGRCARNQIVVLSE